MRVVEYFFPNKDANEKDAIVMQILDSNPQKWQDIFLQIIFSKEYLLNNDKTLNIEERFYSLSKKMKYRSGYNSFYKIREEMIKMSQATMKYKLGRSIEVPIDTLSYAIYFQFIRRIIFFDMADLETTDRTNNAFDGWNSEYIDTTHFEIVENDARTSLRNFINYIYLDLLSREVSDKEL